MVRKKKTGRPMEDVLKVHGFNVMLMGYSWKINGYSWLENRDLTINYSGDSMDINENIMGYYIINVACWNIPESFYSWENHLKLVDFAMFTGGKSLESCPIIIFRDGMIVNSLNSSTIGKLKITGTFKMREWTFNAGMKGTDNKDSRVM
jgi:hypothetical protein